MSADGRYVYGLVPAAHAPALGPIGLENAGTPGSVYPVCAAGVAALVSEYDARREVEPLRRHLCSHDVIGEALKSTTVLPIAFGHLAKSERAAVTERLVRSLSGHARGVEVGRARGQKTIAELALLMSRASVATFERHVRDVAAGWPAEFVFRSSGPWAPFHFVPLRFGASGGYCGTNVTSTQ